MKHKGDKNSPILSGTTSFFAAVIAVLSLIFIKKQPVFGSVVILCAICILAERFISRLTRIKTLKEYMTNSDDADDTMNSEAFFKSMSPIAGIRVDGTIAWYNSPFRDLFSSLADKKISELIPEINIRSIYEKNGAENLSVKIKEDVYSVRTNVKRKVNSEHAAIILYLEKVTELVKIKEELENSRICVAEMVVDNYDEAIDDVIDEERIDTINLLEKNIIGWAQDAGGLVKKLEKDKFTCVFTKKQLDEIIENKFLILQTIKSFNPGIRIPLTLSIGIGMGGDSILENDISAKKALEMALGRGGDQAVIREDGKFRYFGGNSKETEKRTKVKARIMAHNLKELMTGADNVLIMGHKNSDADVVGAAMGIAGMAGFIGKEAKILLITRDETVNSLLKKIEENHYNDGLFIGKAGVKEFLKPKTLLCVCDTHIPEYTEIPELIESIKTKVVIDHHRRSESFIDGADLVYHEPFASSTCEMVAEMMQYFDARYSVSTIEAEALYAGMVMDTKNFMFKTGVRTFEAAAYLRAAGVDTIKVKRLFRESIESYKLKASIVTEAEIYRDNIAISLFSDRVPHLVVAAAADEMLEITDVKASFVVACEGNGNVIISGRSLGEINVQLILEKLGGGGHLMVAGAQLDGITVADAGELLKEAIDANLG